MKKSRKFLLIGILAFGAILVIDSPAPVAALSGTSFQGVLDGSEGNSTTGQHCFGTDVYDLVGPVTVDASGSYEYEDYSIFYDLDMMIAVYENSFDPANPTTNLVGSADDFALFNLNAGTNYYIVVQDLCASGDRGYWGFILTGPGAVLGGTLFSSFTGVIDGSEPSIDNPYSGPGPADIVEIELLAGWYTYFDLSISYGLDMQLSIFDSTFDPANPNPSLIRTLDDVADIYLPEGTYYLVVQDLGTDGDVGAWEFVFIGSVRQYYTVNLGIVQIGAGQAQPAYSEPGGEVARSNGSAVILPADADGNGFDTYMVSAITTYNEETWYGLYVGSYDLVWVPAANVVALTDLP